MKDIDFDELDRAVSSVLEPSAEKKPTPEAEPTETAPVTSEPEKAPEVEIEAEPATAPESVPAPVDEPEAAAPVVAKTPLAIKRRGQFMDVVHPSSDMTTKSEDTPLTPTRKVSLKPIAPADATPEAEAVPSEETAETASVETTEPEAPVESQAPTESVEPAAADRAWPDPLDVMETQEETKDASSAEASTIEDTAVDSSDATETEPDSEEKSASATPFLADTKVDKRPLDAFSADEAPADPLAAPAVPSEPLPPELQADVIAVESNPSERADEDAEKDEPSDKKDDAETGFNASIPQQYASAEAKSDDDHSIFDTSEYHQPLTPAKTKKRGLPGWLIAVVVIFLLAGIGAAAGYFWFYYGL